MDLECLRNIKIYERGTPEVRYSRTLIFLKKKFSCDETKTTESLFGLE